MLSSQDQQFLMEVPWADSKQAGTSSQSGRGLCGEARLFWWARRATSAWPTAKPSQPPELLGSAVVSHWQKYSPPRAAATLGVASHGAEALRGITSNKGQEREQRLGVTYLRLQSWSATETGTALNSSLLSTCPRCQSASGEFKGQLQLLTHMWLLARGSGGGR